ncbi:unnamed protein product [Nesidiocoris tenuis]|uniref:Uncharacterized protein n=1 Tax=Nesidiocoris tenuis TaxID=355587 RepID=A0A6H5G201_9HEMI|nr:unnamed protein product [Nesidiocoris tenuis]
MKGSINVLQAKLLKQNYPPRFLRADATLFSKNTPAQYLLSTSFLGRCILSMLGGTPNEPSVFLTYFKRRLLQWNCHRYRIKVSISVNIGSIETSLAKGDGRLVSFSDTEEMALRLGEKIFQTFLQNYLGPRTLKSVMTFSRNRSSKIGHFSRIGYKWMTAGGSVSSYVNEPQTPFSVNIPGMCRISRDRLVPFVAAE